MKSCLIPKSIAVQTSKEIAANNAPTSIIWPGTSVRAWNRCRCAGWTQQLARRWTLARRKQLFIFFFKLFTWHLFDPDCHIFDLEDDMEAPLSAEPASSEEKPLPQPPAYAEAVAAASQACVSFSQQENVFREWYFRGVKGFFASSVTR